MNENRILYVLAIICVTGSWQKLNSSMAEIRTMQHDVAHGFMYRAPFGAEDSLQEQRGQCLSPVRRTKKFSFYAEHLKERIKALDGRNKQAYRLLVTEFIKLALYCSERLNCDDLYEDDTSIAFYLGDWKTAALYKQIDINCRICASTQHDFGRLVPELYRKKMTYLCKTRIINIGWMILFLRDLHSIEVGDMHSPVFYHHFIKHIDAFLTDCVGASDGMIYDNVFYDTHEISWQEVNEAMTLLVLHFNTLLELISSAYCDRWYWAYFYEGWEQYVHTRRTADSWNMAVPIVVPETSYKHRELFWDLTYQK